MNPSVDLMSRYWTEVDNSRDGTQNITQFLCLQFLLYLVYYSKVLHRICDLSGSGTLDVYRSANRVMWTYSSRWNDLSLRSFFKFLIDETVLNGSKVLLPDVWRTDNSDVSSMSHSRTESICNAVTVVEELEDNRRKVSDTEPFRPLCLSSSIFHSTIKTYCTISCVLCTVYQYGKVFLWESSVHLSSRAPYAMVWHCALQRT